MSKSIFEQDLKQSFKNKRFNELTNTGKNELRLKTIEQFFLELGNKENRFIFYCPDILIVSHMVKIIYDIAYALHKLNYNVVILHEIKGYKCNWIYQEEQYANYKDLKIDYIIEKKSKKSKKDKNQYSFKPTDTIIVPDVFQEMLDNIKEVKLLQKVVLITSYAGITNLATGTSYKNLDVSSVIFMNKKLKDDYEKLYPELKNSFLLSENVIVDKKFFDNKNVDTKEIFPVIGISKLGNEKLAQQTINLFYSKFPNLRVFSFKVLDRDNYEEYSSSLKHCCLYFNMDDTLGFKQPLLEAINMGIPVGTFERRELELDTNLYEEVVVAKRDSFSISEFLGNFCSYWLTAKNSSIRKSVLEIAEKEPIVDFSLTEVQNSISFIFESLHQERIKFFASIKKSIEEENINEVTIQ